MGTDVAAARPAGDVAEAKRPMRQAEPASPPRSEDTSSPELEAKGDFDPTALDRLCEMTNAEFVVEALGDFVEHAQGFLQTIRTAFAEGRAEELHRAAHTLKSNSASIGATALRDAARELEALGKAGRLGEACVARLDQVEAEFNRVRPVIKQKRSQCTASFTIQAAQVFFECHPAEYAETFQPVAASGVPDLAAFRHFADLFFM